MARKKQSLFGLLGKSKSMRSEEYLNVIQRLRLVIILVMLASLGVFIFVAVYFGLLKVINIISASNLLLWGLAFVFVFLGYVIRFGKWRYYMGLIGIKLPILQNFSIYMSLYSMNITPGRVGRIIAGYTINRVTGEKFMTIAPAVTMDIFSDFFGFALLALITSFFFHRLFIYVLIFVIMLSISFLVIIDQRLYKFIIKGKREKLFKRFIPHINRYYSSQNNLNRPSVYLTSILFTLPADILNSSALYLVLLSVGVHASLITVIFIFAAAQIFGMVSTLPGSVGVADVTMIALLGTMLDLSGPLSTAATIMARTATLWFGVIVGTIFLIYTTKYWTIKSATKKSTGKKRIH